MVIQPIIPHPLAILEGKSLKKATIKIVEEGPLPPLSFLRFGLLAQAKKNPS